MSKPNEVYRDDRGWPIMECPTCHTPMLWLGLIYFICPNKKAHATHRIFGVLGEK